jgi:hypothetical protein
MWRVKSKIMVGWNNFMEDDQIVYRGMITLPPLSAFLMGTSNHGRPWVSAYFEPRDALLTLQMPWLVHAHYLALLGSNFDSQVECTYLT